MRLLAQFEGERRELPPGLCHEACAAGSFQGTRGTGARRLQRRLLELFAKAVELRADRSRALSDESEVLGYARRILPLLSRKGFEELRILCQQAEVLDDVGERLHTLTDVGAESLEGGDRLPGFLHAGLHAGHTLDGLVDGALP